MSEMVERVARAIIVANGIHPEATYGGEDEVPVWTLYVADARAAIEAMRVPTQEMIAAVDKAEDDGGYIAAAYEHIDWDEAWTVAIDEALK